ncbi:sensor histidine kinase [Ectopseudomonas guguanensis]|uniref:sensor histidine kinase n=1 Tax=Ectopseudomonas guguanensis TaxID=1198456 RepID=UPI0028613272|nr:7TM-DISM domain-containing protein [Pseudomonas guguanensis]MDR8014367.1 7TM-DISM domain-containing protein [Pseudomonas guguanensis]
MMRRLCWLVMILAWSTWGAAAVEREAQRPAALSVYQDLGGTLNVEQVAALPEAVFRELPERRFFHEYSHSAFWLRLQMSAEQREAHRHWLSVGDPRLSDIQVYVPDGNGWQRMQAGAAHPPESWPVVARQPLFRLQATEQVVLIRVVGDSLLVVEPLLRSDGELLAQRRAIAVADGLTLGIVLLVVPLSLVIGFIMRSSLLAAHAAAVLSYILLVCVVNGYLVHWPMLVPWTSYIRAFASLVGFVCFLGYLRVLLQVARLPSLWARLYDGVLAAYLASALWVVFVDHVQGRFLTEWVMRLAAYGLLPLTLLTAWRRGLPLVWMAWAVPLLYLLQFLARYVFQADHLPWQARQESYSISSTLPGVALLTCTLMTELYRSRARQRWAQQERSQRRLEARGRLEAAVARRTEQLRTSLDARGALLARLGQELRGPLLDIIGSARRLVAMSSSDYPQRIERNARSQLELIEDLAALSHRDELPGPSLRAGSLHAFWREMVEEAELLAARQNNRFQWRLGGNVPCEVMADFGHLRRILLNLLGNAAKFTREGSITLGLDCLERDGQRVRLRFSVEDTGIGIHPDDRVRLGQPFVRGRNVEWIDGFGLGLDIVRQLLEGMNSVLHLADDDRPGSRFSFEVCLMLAGVQDVASVEAGA